MEFLSTFFSTFMKGRKNTTLNRGSDRQKVLSMETRVREGKAAAEQENDEGRKVEA